MIRYLKIPLLLHKQFKDNRIYLIAQSIKNTKVVATACYEINVNQGN